FLTIIQSVCRSCGSNVPDSYVGAGTPTSQANPAVYLTRVTNIYMSSPTFKWFLSKFARKKYQFIWPEIKKIKSGQISNHHNSVRRNTYVKRHGIYHCSDAI